MRVFFSAGEASGDAYAAALTVAIRKLCPSATFEGMGGRRLKETGATIHADSSSWGAIGIFESLRIVPRALGGYYQTKRQLGAGKPGLFIPIDFGYANIRLARHAKKRGWKVLYFVPPGSWRRHKQGADLPAITDAIVTPFPWSAEILNNMGAQAHFFGHPLVELIGPAGETVKREGVVIFPGSREAEIANNLPVIAAALQRLGSPPATVAAASAVTEDRIRQLWGDRGALTITRDRYGALRAAQAGIICSGTATLEAALCGCPNVVIYRVGKVSEVEAKIVRPRFEHIAMSNILLGKRAFPELIQHDASAEGIAEALKPLLNSDSTEYHHQQQAMLELQQTLGHGQAITESAKLAVALCVADTATH